MAHAQLISLLNAKQKNLKTTKIAVFIDNEEIGNQTYQGANSNFIESILYHLIASQGGVLKDIYQTHDKSFILSLDGAHAGHPNYKEFFDPDYFPIVNQGPVIKQPNGGSYSSDTYSISYIKNIAKKYNIPIQTSVPRSDKPTGTTVGPILATKLGIKTVDIGNAMFAMHSCRETAGIKDYKWMVDLITEFFNE